MAKPGISIGRRWAQHRKADSLKRAALPDAMTAPGSLVAKYPLEIVQLDHTPADVFLVNEYNRQVIGRLWRTFFPGRTSMGLARHFFVDGGCPP